MKIQKRNEVLIGWSDDGFKWNREFKIPFIGVDEDYNAWNAGNVQSVTGVPIIVGDSLYFYVSGRYNSKPKHDSNFSTGLATLRRDGFVSLHANNSEGEAISDIIKVSHQNLFINANVRSRKGKITVEILDGDNHPIPGFTRNDCVKITNTDGCKIPVVWKHKTNLSELIGKDIRIKFYLTDGDLYAFWLSPWQTGESEGYTAGGGPGLSASGIDIPLSSR